MRPLVAVALCLSFGCDPSATSGVSGGQSDVSLSQEFESCGATIHCEGGLRCVDGRCLRNQTAVMGEYYAAAGRRASKEERKEEALAAYEMAMKAYEGAKLPPPPEVHCGYGRALVDAGGDPQRFELAARLFHRCLMALPPSSKARKKSLYDLAGLEVEGLDPEHLAKGTLADRYLTKQAAAPDTSNLTLAVTVAKEPRGRSFAKFKEMISGEPIKEALVGCWQANWEESKNPSMSVTLRFKNSYRLDSYDDFDRTILEIVGDEGAAGDAYGCAKAALTPLAEEHVKGREDESRWQADVTFVLGPSS